MAPPSTLLRLFPLYLLAVAVPVSVGLGGMAVGLVLVSALGLALARRGDVCLPPRSVTLALATLIVTYFLATLLAAPNPSQWHKFAEELWIKLLLLAVPVLLGPHRRHAPRILACCLALGVVAAAFGVWQHFSAWDPIRHRSLVSPHGHVSPAAFFGHHLSWGGQLLVFVLLASVWLLRAQAARTRAVLAGALMVLLAALAWSYARGALFGVVPGLALAVLLAKGRARWLGLGLVVLPLLVAMALPDVGLHLLRLLDLDNQATRLNLWHSSVLGVAERPLAGWGPGNFDTMMRLHEVYGFYDVRAHAHNDLIMHAVNAGVPGFVAALALMVAVAMPLVRGARRPTAGSWVAAGALVAHLGITMAGMFQVYQTDDEVEILIYLVLGLGLAAAGDCQEKGRVRHWAKLRPATHGEPAAHAAPIREDLE